MRFVYVTVVWGDDFTETWLDTCLPLQIEQLQLSKRNRFVVYTDLEQPMQKLGGLIPEALIRRFGSPDGLNSHQRMAWLHKRAIEEWAAPDTCLVFLSPDVLYADGAFEFGRKQILAGKKAVMVPMFRAMKEAMVPAFRSKTSFAPRELLALSFKRFHGLTDALFWDAVIFHSLWPSHVYFHTQYGMRGNCWHQHPFAVVLPKAVSPNGTLDADLLLKSGISKEDMHVVTDSDDFCAVEITAARSHIPMPDKKRTIEGIAAWAKCNATPLDRWFFRQTMRWHTVDLPPETAQAESVLDVIMAQIANHAEPEIANWGKYS